MYPKLFRHILCSIKRNSYMNPILNQRFWFANALLHCTALEGLNTRIYMRVT